MRLGKITILMDVYRHLRPSERKAVFEGMAFWDNQFNAVTNVMTFTVEHDDFQETLPGEEIRNYDLTFTINSDGISRHIAVK